MSEVCLASTVASVCPDAPLTAQQVAVFHSQGFLSIATPLIGVEEISWARRTIERLFASGAGRAEGRNFDLAAKGDATDGPTLQILHPRIFAPELRRLTVRDTALAIARQLLGEAAVHSGEHAILKPAHHGGVTPWHQDEAFRDPQFDYSEISVWIALTEANEANGAVRYLPGSHVGDVRPHRMYGGARDANCIECVEPIDAGQTHLAALPPGGIVIHHGRTVHGAGPNTSDTPRLGYVLVLAVPPAPRGTPRTFAWRTDFGAPEQKRRRAWRRRGGIVIEQIRRVRFGPLGDRCYRVYVTLSRALTGWK